MKQWDLDEGSRRCSACDAALADGQVCWSALVEQAGEPLPVRRDFCEGCRDRMPAGDGPRWRTVVQKPAKLPKTVIDPEMAVEMVERLLAEGEADPAASRLAYLVVLLLLRRRILRLASMRETRDGAALVVRRPGKRGRWVVREHKIEPEELRAMDRELSTLMALEVASADAEVRAGGGAAVGAGKAPAAVAPVTA